MRAVIQRVNGAVCTVDGEVTGKCGAGLCIMLGIYDTDSELEARLLAEKILKMRIFRDDRGRMNRSLLDIDGEMLVISNFTLCADCVHGHRPDFMHAMNADEANRLYEYFISLVRVELRSVGTGSFGAHMHIASDLDGPVTMVLDSTDIYSKERNNQAG